MFGFTIWPVLRSRMPVLEERAVDAHDDAADALALGGQRVEDEAAVLHADDARRPS